MLLIVLLASALVAMALGECSFPNGTDTKLVWWQGSGTAAIQITSLATFDSNGNSEYPLKLTEPLIIQLHMKNSEAAVWDGADFTQTIKIWQYGGFAGCSWSEVPTFGMLDNMPSCNNGIPCPLPLGENDVKITMDFTGFDSIIGLLKNDSPYQIQFLLSDAKSKHSFSIFAQARALTKK